MFLAPKENEGKDIPDRKRKKKTKQETKK